MCITGCISAGFLLEDTVSDKKFVRFRDFFACCVLSCYNPPFSIYSIPTPHQLLGPISGNITKKKELTLYKRGLVLGAKLGGCIEAEISECLNLSDSIVRTTILQTVEHNKGYSKLQSSWPRCLSDQEEQIFL